MFKVGHYKICFEKQWNVHPRIIIPGLAAQRIFVWCHISNEITKSVNSSAAILNPIDRYDKILGKKIALTKALKEGGFENKDFRTEVWKAFWEWVTSWEIQSDIVKRTPQNPV